MARFSALAFLALFTSVATAFVTPVAPHFRSRSVSATSSTTRMSAAPVAPPTADALREMAESCKEDGCSVEAVTNLLDQLKAKKMELEMQLVTVEDVLTMMDSPSTMTEKGELEKLVMAVGRLFSPGDDDYPYLSYPTGYSGEVNKEKKDAWDYNVNSQLKPTKPVYK